MSNKKNNPIDNKKNKSSKKKNNTTENDSDSITERKEIISEVVDIIKIELDKKLGSIKNDIVSDIKEMNQRQKVPEPNIESSSPISPPPLPQQPFDIAGMIKKLSGKDGSVSANQLQSMISGAQQQIQTPAPNNGKPIDMKDLTAGQVEYMKMQNQQNMMMTMMTSVLPLLMQPQQSSTITEMMSRVFMEKINSSITMDKLMVTSMQKLLMGNMKTVTDHATATDNLMTPITDALSKTAVNNG